MDKLTKFAVALALVFLAVLIGVGIVNKPAQKRVEPPPLVESALVPERPEAEEKEQKAETAKKEEPKRTIRQEQLEQITEQAFIPPEEDILSPSSAERQPYPQDERPLLPGWEEGMQPEMYPPDYIPGEYPEGTMPPVIYPPGEYPPDYPPGEFPPPEELPKGQHLP